MTLSSQNPPEKKSSGDNPLDKRPLRKDGKADNDIRNHPDYKTPWWRKPMTNVQYWLVFVGAVIVVAAAIVITLSLGVKLF